MTIDGKTICKLIQSFPVLLILAQKHEKCLKTPFIYKPPTPTHAPEYYEAYDALIQNLFGHDCYYNKKSHENKPCHYPEHETPIYGHGTPTYAHEYPTYGSEYPTYGHSYPTYGHAIYGHSDSSIYPVLSEGNQAFTRNGFINNMTKYTYKSNYAPSQKHNVKRRVKIVVKSKGQKRSQKLKG
ncbi:unnamed protein product [Pieris brassicae]|uniref:Uncharacterized protein n=1 Tax=Pieris brassicae TaxID=7116 RepID=A0A9P0X9A5_PIEBR|nr:unnamed protein product [Pieris brassicae]